MLVRSIKPFKDYTGTRETPVGELFVVYAKEVNEKGKLVYYIIPYAENFADEEYDPLYFDAENFEIIKDMTSKKWLTKTIELRYGNVIYTSFPEWFENDFYIRAHDWDLRGDSDFNIIRKYKKEYEQLYSEYVK